MSIEHYIERIARLICKPHSVTHARATGRLLLLVSVLMMLFVALGALLPGLKIGWCFGEGDIMTWFSFSFLLAVGFLSRAIGRSDAARGGQTKMWKILSYGFLFLAFDELLRIHETLDRLIHRIFGIHETNFTDHLDDFIIVIYGMIGAAILLRYWRETLRFVKVWPWFLGGIMLASGSEMFDFLSGAKPMWLSLLNNKASVLLLIDILDVVEETLKVWCEVLFVGAFFGVYWSSRAAESSPRQTSIAPVDVGLQ